MTKNLSNSRVRHLKNGMTGLAGTVEPDGYVSVSWDMKFSDNGGFSRLTNGARVEDLVPEDAPGELIVLREKVIERLAIAGKNASEMRLTAPRAAAANDAMAFALRETLADIDEILSVSPQSTIES